MEVIEADNERARMGGNNPPLEETLADTHKTIVAEFDMLILRANATSREVKDDDALGKIGEIVTDALALSKRLDVKRVDEKEPFLTGGRKVDAFFKQYTERLDRVASVFTDIASVYQREKAAAAARKANEEAQRLRDEEERLRKEAEAAKRPATAARKEDAADEAGAKADDAEARAAVAANDFTKVKTDTGVTAGAKKDWTFEITDYEVIPLDRLRPYFKRSEIESALKAHVRIHKGASPMPGVHFKEEVKATFRK